MLGAEAQDASVETIEGVAGDAGLHPLQIKFLEHAALQCGICTPGFIMASKALLEKHPNPDESTIRYWLAGNLCRCTGYDKIVRAVQTPQQNVAPGVIQQSYKEEAVPKLVNFGSLCIDWVYQVPNLVAAGETITSTARAVCGRQGIKPIYCCVTSRC